MICPQNISRSFSLEDNSSNNAVTIIAVQLMDHFMERQKHTAAVTNSARNSSIPMAWVVVDTPNRPIKGCISN